MFIKKIILFLLFLLVPQLVFAQVSNLDEIYREIVKSENQDYLPLFVKNREAPDFLRDIEQVETKQTNAQQEIIELQNKRKIMREKQKAEELKWQAVILAVQQNQLTPFDLEEIDKRVKDNNPAAVEVLAFMNAKGQGIEQNLIKAFLLYQKALNLNVNQAKENAIIVYKSMNREQKEILKNSSPL